MAEDSYQRRQNDVEDHNAHNITQKSTFSNNLFQLPKKDTSMIVPTSAGFESNAAKQDANESFNTAKEEDEDMSGVFKKDTSMDVPRRDPNAESGQKAPKKQKTKGLDLEGVPHGRAQSETEADDNTGAVPKHRLQDMLDEDLLQDSNNEDADDEELNPYIQ